MDLDSAAIAATTMPPEACSQTAPRSKAQSRLQRCHVAWLVHVAYARSTLLYHRDAVERMDAVGIDLPFCKALVANVAIQTDDDYEQLQVNFSSSDNCSLGGAERSGGKTQHDLRSASGAT